MRQDGPTRAHGGNSSIKLTDVVSVDMCQIDDFMVSVVAAILVDAGKRVRIYSKDGRFRSLTLQLPRVRHPFYCVVQTFADEVGVPIYQRDSKQLYESILGAKVKKYVHPSPTGLGGGMSADMARQQEREHCGRATSL